MRGAERGRAGRMELCAGGREQKVWRGTERGRVRRRCCATHPVCAHQEHNKLQSVCVCVFVGRLCVLIHQCARPD